MKRLGIILAILALVITAVIAFLLLSRKDVTFTLKGTGYSVVIRTLEGKVVQEISTSQDIQLRSGEYTYSITGKGVEGRSMKFSTSDTNSISVTPKYLSRYIATLAQEERQGILSLLSKTYPTAGTISIQSLTIDASNSWAYGRLTLNSNTSDIYRFVLKRQKDMSWNIAVKPAIIISTDTNDIPKEILYSLY